MNEDVLLKSFRDELYGISSRYATTRQGEDLLFLGCARRGGMMADDFLIEDFEHRICFDARSRGEEEVAIFLGGDCPRRNLLDANRPVVGKGCGIIEDGFYERARLRVWSEMVLRDVERVSILIFPRVEGVDMCFGTRSSELECDVAGSIEEEKSHPLVFAEGIGFFLVVGDVLENHTLKISNT